MKFKYDPEADAIYIYLGEKPYAYGRELDEERRIDYASDNTPIGVELLWVSKGVNLNGLPRVDEIAETLKHHRIRVYTMGGYPIDGGIMFNVDLAYSQEGCIAKVTAHLKQKEEVTV